MSIVNMTERGLVASASRKIVLFGEDIGNRLRGTAVMLAPTSSSSVATSLLCIAAMPSRRGFAKLTTDDGAEDSDGTEIIEDDASSPGVDRGAFGEMFALAQSVGADDAEVEDAASAAQVDVPSGISGFPSRHSAGWSESIRSGANQ